MKGTDKIIAHIEVDAKAEAEAVLAEAAAKCQEIGSSYETKARALYEAAAAANQKEAELKPQNARRISEMESKRSALCVKQQQLSEAFERAQTAITQLPEDQYEAFLVKLAASAIQSGDEELILNEQDRARFGEKLLENINKTTGKKLTLSEETRAFAGGLILKRGNIEVNATLELLTANAKRELSGEVAAILFK